MNKFIKRFPKQVDIALVIVGFSIGANFFVFLKLSGLDEIGFYEFSELNHFHWSAPSMAGLLIGVAFSLLEYRVFPLWASRVPHYAMILLRMTTFSMAMVTSLIIVHTFTDVVLEDESLSSSILQTREFLWSGVFISLFVYLMLLGMALNFVRAMGNRFGHGILFNYLVGKYREPVEENRIFMFVDLNGSTRIAELLGHTKYSRFLNKCFSDLASLLPKYDAEIYQYVGDEAVVTWNMNRLKDHTRPAFLFFEYERLLLENDEEYQQKFGVSPTFKASIHAGLVIVTELGIRRKELAYHGDVLNTASRVLELCSQMKKKLLTTAVLSDIFRKENSLSVHFVSDLVLRGKNNTTAVFCVEKET